MIAYTRSGRDDEFQLWGRPEDIGFKTISGAPRLFAKIELGSIDQPLMAGLFKATQGVFEGVYEFHEHICMMHGLVLMTDSAGTTVYGPGDSWIIKKGEFVRWTIQSDFMVKSFMTCG
jgi:uncharacterized cupin superfamily protein